MRLMRSSSSRACVHARAIDLRSRMGQPFWDTSSRVASSDPLIRIRRNDDIHLHIDLCFPSSISVLSDYRLLVHDGKLMLPNNQHIPLDRFGADSH